MSYMNNNQSIMNGVSITEDTVLTDPNTNVNELYPSALTASKTIAKEQPYNLANTIQGAGNAGALLMVQNVNTGQVTHMTNKFYLQAMDISLKERVQIMETFGKPVASFFGETAKVYNFSGVALEADTTKKSQKGEYFHGTSLLYLYQTYMRGTKLVDGAAIAILQVANHSVYGYPIQFSYRAMGDLDKAIQFSFSFFVKEHLYEIPGVVDKSLMQNNIRMGSSNNPNVRKLEALRVPLQKINAEFTERADKLWQNAHEEEQKSKRFLGKLKAGYENLKAQIIGEEAKFMTEVDDYIGQIKDMFGETIPNSQQASSFGIIDINAYTAKMKAGDHLLGETVH